MRLVINRRALPECIGRTSRRLTALFHKDNLNAFQTVTECCCSGTFSILCPAEPAKLLCMNTVVNIIMLCHLSGQTDLNRLQPQSFSNCTACSTVFCPCGFPSKILHMGTVFYAAFVRLILQTDFERFHSLVFSDRSACSTVLYFILPAVCLNLGLIKDMRRADFFCFLRLHLRHFRCF